ncbi:hypothetical protein DFH07DRAFT_941056 [Mycena maculata]|uniref:Uncharacterized protein n=1 Tax=Mycena maculata TaxID=230809 RepID=A0AAD7NCT7_9AGAR|nr:hypothetical protein DFH07DRAFT_941056 [Mycena maculata]
MMTQELCPELWTNIRVFHCRPGQLEMVDEYLRRSNALLLDISVHLPFNFFGDRQLATFLPVVLRICNFPAIKHNVGRNAARLLESLELRITGRELQDSQALYLESLPALKSLVVDGIPDVLDITSTEYSHLLDELARHTPPPTELTPHLRHLTLRIPLPNLTRVSGPFISWYISSLTSLSLGDFHGGDGFRLLWGLLATPLLEELSLDSIRDGCWGIFANALSEAQLTFPALRILRLSSITNCTLHPYLRTAFPTLEQLHIRHSDSSVFVQALSSHSAPTNTSVLWSKLAIDNADYRALRSVVDTRIVAGCPLRVLEVDLPPSIDASALQWLQEHVMEFKRSPRKLAPSYCRTVSPFDCFEIHILFFAIFHSFTETPDYSGARFELPTLPAFARHTKRN